MSSSIIATSQTGSPREAHHHRPMSDEVMSALADKLGMSKDDLKAKLSSSDDPRQTLNQLASDKGISRQELRQTIRAAMPKRPDNDGDGDDGGARPPAGSAGGSGLSISFNDEVGQKLLSTLAKKMDMSADDLKAQLDKGGDLRQILDSHNVSHDDVRAAFQDAFKSWQSYGASGSTTDAYKPEYNAVDAQL